MANQNKVKYPIRKKRLYATGEKSLLDLHREGKIYRGAMLIGLSIEKRSHWDKGRSFRIKGIKALADATNYSSRHVRRCLAQLKDVGWLKQTSPPGAEYLVFEMYPFGEEARASRETTAAPLDESCPLLRLSKGEISRSECVAWHYANVGWQETLGQTVPRSLREWAALIGLSARTVWALFRSSDLFQRISTTTHATVLKVFPFLDSVMSSEAAAADEERQREAEIQASYSGVLFTEDGLATYRGEQYRQKGNGYERYMADIRKWIYVALRAPDEVIIAYKEGERSALA